MLYTICIRHFVFMVFILLVCFILFADFYMLMRIHVSIFVPYNYTLFLIRLLLGNGCTFKWDSVIDARFLPLQFPFVTFVQKEFTTRSARVFVRTEFVYIGIITRSAPLPLASKKLF